VSNNVDEHRNEPRKDFANSYGMLMDCSEATYGQFLDHFQDLELVRALLTNLKVIFITHMHGDHQIGLSKVLLERDLAIQNAFNAEFVSENKEHFEIFVVIPYFMQEFLNLMTQSFEYPELVVLIPSDLLNPEPEKHYIVQDPVKFCTPREKVDCVEMTKEECQKRVEKMESEYGELAQRFQKVVQEKLGLIRVHAVEAFHCYEAYGCMVEAPNWKVSSIHNIYLL